MPAMGLTRGALRGSTPGSGPTSLTAERGCCWGWDGGCLCHPVSRKPAVVRTQPPWSHRKNHVSSAAALQKGSSKQAGVVFPGRGGGTRLGLQPCSSRQGNAGNAGEVEEKEGCPQQHGCGLSPRNPLLSHCGDITRCDEGQGSCHACPPRAAALWPAALLLLELLSQGDLSRMHGDCRTERGGAWSGWHKGSATGMRCRMLHAA